MKNKDDFDIFLENELKKSTMVFSDDEFKQKVLDSLPVFINRNRSRNLIIYTSGILSCLLFFLIIDLNMIGNSIINFYNLIDESIIPSLETIIFISMFCFILYVIPKDEYSYDVY